MPPHPAPTALVVLFEADVGLTFGYGLLVAIPAVIIAGPLYSRTLRGLVSRPLAGFVREPRPAAELPGRVNSFLSSLLPVVVLTLVFSLQGRCLRGARLRPF